MTAGKIETRSWPTNYRGLVLICASLTPYSNTELDAIAGPAQFVRLKHITNSLPEFVHVLGHAIAIGTLVNCRRMTKADEDATFVAYRDGLYCHIYENVIPITPIPWKGAQGWKSVPIGIQQQLFSTYGISTTTSRNQNQLSLL